MKKKIAPFIAIITFILVTLCVSFIGDNTRFLNDYDEFEDSLIGLVLTPLTINLSWFAYRITLKGGFRSSMTQYEYVHWLYISVSLLILLVIHELIVLSRVPQYRLVFLASAGIAALITYKMLQLKLRAEKITKYED